MSTERIRTHGVPEPFRAGRTPVQLDAKQIEFPWQPFRWQTKPAHGWRKRDSQNSFSAIIGLGRLIRSPRSSCGIGSRGKNQLSEGRLSAGLSGPRRLFAIGLIPGRRPRPDIACAACGCRTPRLSKTGASLFRTCRRNGMPRKPAYASVLRPANRNPG